MRCFFVVISSRSETSSSQLPRTLGLVSDVAAWPTSSRNSKLLCEGQWYIYLNHVGWSINFFFEIFQSFEKLKKNQNSKFIFYVLYLYLSSLLHQFMSAVFWHFFAVFRNFVLYFTTLYYGSPLFTVFLHFSLYFVTFLLYFTPF